MRGSQRFSPACWVCTLTGERFGYSERNATRSRLAAAGVVFQNPEDQLFLASILDDVALPLRNRGVAREAAERRARKALDAVGLLRLGDRPGHRLSWGERKRAAMAAALALDPLLLILDEPTSELDGRSVRELAAVLNSLRIAKLFASHHLEFVRQTASRCVVLVEGRIQAAGPVPEILGDRELLAAAGLV